MGLYLDEESESQFILSPVDSFTLGPLKIVPLPFLRVAVSVVDSTAVISGPRGKVIQLVQHLAEPTATGATVYPDG